MFYFQFRWVPLSFGLFMLICVLFSVPLGSLSFGLYTFLCVISAPVAVAKSGISILHLYVASENIVAIDLADRAATAQEKKE